MEKPLAEISECWPTRIVLRLLAANLSTTAKQLSATSVLIQQNQHGDYKQNDMASCAEGLLYKDPTKSERNLFSVSVDFFSEHYANTCVAVLIKRGTCKSLFSFWGQKNFKLRNLPSKTSTLFLSRRSACLFFWTTATKSATILKNFEVNILHIVRKESTLLRGNLCIYKCFMDVLYIFDRVFKKNWEMRPILDR